MTTNPFLDPNCPFEYENGKPVYVQDIIIPEERTRPTRNPRTPQNSTTTTTIDDLDWEQTSPKDTDGTKTLIRYDQSLARLQNAGYERHPSPQETFRNIINGLENKLSPTEKALYDDMISSYGEWLNIAIEITEEKQGLIKKITGSPKRTLTTYENPQLHWNNNHYDINGHTNKKEYDITDVALQTWVDLDKLPEQLIIDLYGRTHQQLPQEMRTGNNRAQLYLPTPGTPWPAGRGDVGRFGIGAGGSHGASRGVRKK